MIEVKLRVKLDFESWEWLDGVKGYVVSLLHAELFLFSILDGDFYTGE